MLPERLGPYRIVRKLGRGGMGMVFLGVDDAAQQTAAIKLLAGDMALMPDFRERFKAEIETLRKLNHPNIVQIFGYGEQDDQIFYAMEYVSGSSLEEQLARGRAFQWREVAQIGIEVARALRHAHDRGVIHRDIKPGNLLMTEETPLRPENSSNDESPSDEENASSDKNASRETMVVKLSDFGIARLFGNARLTSAGSVLGTAEFMAPEQAEGRAVDPRSDLYSLGAVLYVLLARRPLYIAKSFLEMLEKQRTEKPAPLHSVASDVPAEFEQIIHRLLEKEPERRLGTATVLERRLEAMVESLTLHPAPLGVTVEPALKDMPAGAPPTPVNPLAVTVAATHHVRELELPSRAPQTDIPQSTTPPPERLSVGEVGAESVVADASALRSDESQHQQAAPRFVPVRPGEFDDARPEPSETPWISPQSWALMIGLIALGLFGWYFLRPPSADALYHRIERQTADGSTDALLSAENDIRQFLQRFPADPRAQGLSDDLERIETSRLEKRLDLHSKGMNLQTALTPLERCYIDAVNTARYDANSGIAKFQAMIDLFEPDDKATDARCIELAKRRLAELTQNDSQRKDQIAAIEKRLQRADELAASDPARAAAIRRDLIVLYQDKPWAKEILQRARTTPAKP